MIGAGMEEQFLRTAMLLGDEGIQKLKDCRVAVFGIGGVGGYAAEALVRSGIGSLDIIDNDKVNITNINRQIIATHATIGQMKTQVMKARMESIQPNCKVKTWECFYLPEKRNLFPFDKYDYIIDAIDTVTAKIDLVLAAQENKVPIISSMGTGNKLHPELLEIADIYETSVCPLARVMRRELKSRGIKKLKVVYSKEPPRKPISGNMPDMMGERTVPGSTAFVPAAAGLMIAAFVIRNLSGISVS